MCIPIGPIIGKRCTHFRVLRLAIVFFLLPLFAANLRGQGTTEYTVLQTGGGTPLVSSEQTLSLNGYAAPVLTFNFGFFTHETLTSDLFLDSFTVSFLNPLNTNVALLTTSDASGVVWAPRSSGTVPLSESVILREAIPVPGAAPILGQGIAFSASVPIPEEFLGSSVNVVFDLFDNQNALSSLGWFSGLSVVDVPEPQVATLLTLAGLIIAIIRRKK